MATGQQIASTLAAELERNGWAALDSYWIKLAAGDGDPGDSKEGREVLNLREVFSTVAATLDAKPHDANDAPPKGFTRYRIEIDVHDLHQDPSALLEVAQDLAKRLL